MIRKASYSLLLLILYWSAAALCVNSFMDRWSLRERAEGYFGFETLLAGHAARPWAYRVLVPKTVNGLAQLIESHVDLHDSSYLLNDSGVRAAYFQGDPKRWTASFSLRYHLTLALMGLALLACLCLLRALPRYFGIGDGTLRDFAPLAFAILLPLAYLRGGYLYDFPELALIAACFLAAVTRPWLLLILVPLAVVNKETAILLPVILAPLLLAPGPVRTRRRELAILGAAGTLGLVAFFVIHQAAAGNPGGSVEHHFAENVAFWLRPRTYVDFSMMLASGMPVPKLHTLVVVAPAAVLLVCGFRVADERLRLCLWVTAALNLPLLLLFGDRDELRNLSLLFIPVYLLVLQGVRSLRCEAERL